MKVSRAVVPVALAAGLLGGLAQPASAAVLTHRFKLAGTSACLDAAFGGGLDNVRLATCGPGNRQLWRWSSPSTHTVLHHVGTGTCAGRIRAGVGLSGCDGAVSKRWKVTGTPASLLIKAADTGHCLSRTGSATVGTRPCDGTSAQQWHRA
ncbi:RICIN domain-containing protein [Allokutzneria albata]|uniref:Ricin-type beta-trefoil lectin domain-containing protein n=1 Tax=Allokutzneria albata TaxID=211114 RepID=A0A1G9VN49_ALLAB|nr:RICIN domain-containing protein [Allokutzneria albata]SDM73493.1 Ricin-type beta-trefoil lectin domain-containing protein [Allokutzneria albata]